MNRHRLRVDQLWVGAPLEFDVFDATGRLLLSRGYQIESESQLERLVEVGLFSDAIPPGQSSDAVRDGMVPGADRMRVHAGARISVYSLISDCSVALAALSRGQEPGAAAANGNFESSLRALAERLRRACALDSDAALAHILLATGASYPIRQSINVATLTALLLARVAHDEVRSRAAIAAALTMNIAMLALQEELYQAQGPLTDAQRAQLREHPLASEQMLRVRGVADPMWLQIVVQHHEALDGSGYPLGLKGEAICREAQVIALADRYCGMVSERAYRPGLAPGVALKEIYGKHGGALDPALIGTMVKAFGLYPPGTLVSLVNKEVGVVTKRLLDIKHPVVHTLFQDPRRPYESPRKRMTASQPQYEIIGVVARSAVACPIDPLLLWPRSVTEDSTNAH